MSCAKWLISFSLHLTSLLFSPLSLLPFPPFHLPDFLSRLYLTILSYPHLVSFLPFHHNQSTPSSAAAAAAEDTELLTLLVSMGFSSNGCRRGMQATGATDPDTVMNWYYNCCQACMHAWMLLIASAWMLYWVCMHGLSDCACCLRMRCMSWWCLYVCLYFVDGWFPCSVLWWFTCAAY